MRLLPRIIKQENQNEPVKLFEFQTDFEQLRIIEEEKSAIEEEVVEDTTLIDAQIKADEMIEAARIEGEKICQDAYEKGFQQGMEAGKEAGYQQAYKEHKAELDQQKQNLENELTDLIELCTVQKQQVLERYLDDLKNLSVAVAEKVIHVSLKSSSDVIKRMIIAATDKLKKTQWAKIYISKCDSRFLVEGDGALLKSLTHLSDNIKIVTMDNEENGICIVELPDEVIDASVSAQMENIKDILSNARL